MNKEMLTVLETLGKEIKRLENEVAAKKYDIKILSEINSDLRKELEEIKNGK